MMTLEVLCRVGATTGVFVIRMTRIVLMRRVLMSVVAGLHAVMRVVRAGAYDRSDGGGEALQRHQQEQRDEHEFSNQRKHRRLV